MLQIWKKFNIVSSVNCLCVVFKNDDTSFLSVPYIRFTVTTVGLQCAGCKTLGFWLQRLVNMADIVYKQIQKSHEV